MLCFGPSMQYLYTACPRESREIYFFFALILARRDASAFFVFIGIFSGVPRLR